MSCRWVVSTVAVCDRRHRWGPLDAVQYACGRSRLGRGRVMPTAWFQRILSGLWTLPRELGRLPEYATEAERLHQEIRAGEGRLAASGERLLLLRVVETGGSRLTHDE